MSEWHLKKLRDALTKKGWRIADAYEPEAGESATKWKVQRSTAVPPLALDFDRFDHNGNPLPVDRSYGANVEGHKHVHLYFYRTATFPPALAAFLTALDQLELELKKETGEA